MNSSRLRILGRSVALVAFVTLLLGVERRAAAAVTPDAELLFNEQFFGLMNGPLDVDYVKFTEVQGSKITITCQRDGNNALNPALQLLDEAENPIAVGGTYHQSAGLARIKKFTLPYSGSYLVRVATANGVTGTYKLSVKGSPRKNFDATGSIGMVGEVDSLPIFSRAEGKLSGKITATSGDLKPTLVELVSPNGNLVAIADRFRVRKGGTQLVIDGIKLPLLGQYAVRITGTGGTTGSYTADLKVTPPKTVSGKVGEDEYPKNIPDPGAPIHIKEVSFGRGLRNPDGITMRVVSPFTTVEIDPISDLPIAGTLNPLFPSIDENQPFDFALGPLYSPPVVPRNAVIVVHFDRKISEASLHLDANRLTTAETPFTVFVNGSPVTVECFVQGKKLILNPAVGNAPGFPGSPVVVNANGDPVADPAGVAKIDFTSIGNDTVTSTEGGTLDPRSDAIGTTDAGGAAIAFNPGNDVLDFFQQSSAGAAGGGFNGFLPDRSSPRLIREFGFSGPFTPANGDSFGAAAINLVLDTAYDGSANHGAGEWAGGVLRLRPDGPNTEPLVIIKNSSSSLGGGKFLNTFELAKKIVIPLGAGQTYQIVRAEYFEPDPAHPINPDLWDPNDPQAFANTQLKNFALVKDRNGNVENVDVAVDPLSTFSFLFSEPMLESSFRAYESFVITDDPPSANPGLNYVSQISLTQGGKRVTLSPSREIQFGASAGTSELVGLGTLPKSLRFHIKVVPTGDVLQALLGEQAYTALVAEGERGVTDSGGQPLAFPLSLISQMSPTVDYSFSFLSAGDASLQDFGAVVERFKGQPQTGFDLDNNAGVSYRDIPTSICGPKGNIFGPFIADVNLFSNGFLSGAPVQFFQKVHDDVNPPIDGQFSPFPFGTSTPIGGNSVLGGARFQHLYRAVDCSPDTVNLAGTKLHLKQLAYCPIGGTVVNTILKDVTIHAGHTTFIPDTAQNCGIPSGSATGLKDAMGGHHIPLGDTSSATYIPGNYDGVDASSQILPRQLCFGSETTPGIPDFYTGKQFKIDVNNLFIPSGSTRKYHPLPNSEFDFQFPYDNGFRDPAKARAHSLLLEYRITANPVGTQPSTANGFTFAVGILSSALPRFRVYSIGSGCVACCTDTSSAGNCTATCFNSFSPVLNPPLDPDAVITAAGPDPAPPGLDCYCLRVPTAQTPPPPGCTDQTTATPTIFDVATGAQPNPNSGNKHNNYGDNSRYYMVFNYVKKESTIRSPFVRVQPDLGGTQVVTWLAPIFHPSLAELPVGTSFNVRFRASGTGLGAADASAWVTPAQMGNEVNALNDGSSRCFIQFEATIIGNTSTQLVPVIEELILPFRQ